jgi:nitrate reductase NapE component
MTVVSATSKPKKMISLCLAVCTFSILAMAIWVVAMGFLTVMGFIK